MEISREQFKKFINDNIHNCRKIIINEPSISSYVICCWVSPFGTFEKRCGYFEDSFEAAEFYGNFIEKYKDYSKVYITNTENIYYYKWSEEN